MQVKIFSVYDSKAQAFNLPHFFQTIGIALRAFEDLVKDPNSQLYKHADDYSLYEIGMYDDSDATFKMESPVKLVGMGSDYRIKPAPEKIDLGAVLAIGKENNAEVK